MQYYVRKSPVGFHIGCCISHLGYLQQGFGAFPKLAIVVTVICIASLVWQDFDAFPKLAIVVTVICIAGLVWQDFDAFPKLAIVEGQKVAF